MGQVFEGEVIARGGRFAIVAARFNETITRQLLGGAESGLRRHGVSDDGIDVVWVPGSFEIPVVAAALARQGRYDAIICLGAIVRGETGHYEHVAAGAAQGIARVAMDTGVPTIFGVLTTDTVEQAEARAGGKLGNKGYEAAVTAIEMASLLRVITPSTVQV